jgi:hypothetical protein
VDEERAAAGVLHRGAEAPADLCAFGYSDRRLGHYQEDHLVPLELGGDPSDPRNLWLEPKAVAGGWGADRKDELEWVLNRLVSTGRLPLVEAQRAIATDWIAAYRRYVRAVAAD